MLSYSPGFGQSSEHSEIISTAGANQAAVVVFNQGSSSFFVLQVHLFFQLRPEDDEDSDHNLTPILERKSGRQPFTKKDTVLQLELQFENEMRKPHYY